MGVEEGGSLSFLFFSQITSIELELFVNDQFKARVVVKAQTKKLNLVFILIVQYKVTFGVVASATVVLRLNGCYVGSKIL